MTFEPTPITGGFVCPCTDAYGEQATLVDIPHDGTDHLPDGGHVHNYACDQNGDRWQYVERADGSAAWHYLGRPVRA